MKEDVGTSKPKKHELPGTCTCITSFVGSFQSVYSSINFPKNVMNLIKNSIKKLKEHHEVTE